MNTFFEAIAGKSFISIIAEIKKCSPSHGLFTKYSENKLVEAYESGGAKAISVVTDFRHFGGSLELLQKIVALTHLPVLRKDFIDSREELDNTVKAGASAILLIAHNLSRDKLQDLCVYSIAQGLTPVIEIHTKNDLDKTAEFFRYEGVILGINNRDLKTHTVDVNHALSLLTQINTHIPVIVESGISSYEELKGYQEKVDGALIGTALLVADNPQEKLWSLQPQIPTVFTS